MVYWLHNVTDAPEEQPCETTTSYSWWEKDFVAKLPTEQARMRRSALPAPVQAYFDALLNREESENLCRRTQTPSKTRLASISGGIIQNIARIAGTDSDDGA